MATSRMSPDAAAIISEIQIAAPPERVFQAIVDPRQVLKWWGQKDIYRCTEFEMDLRTGEKWRSTGIGPDGRAFEVHGEILDVDRPRVLAYSWVSSWTGDAKTLGRWFDSPRQHHIFNDLWRRREWDWRQLAPNSHHILKNLMSVAEYSGV